MSRINNSETKIVPMVGYGKPPAQTQFKPGVSGNRKGRPKGSLNLGTILARTLRDKVIINENGRRKSVTKLEAALTQVTNKAASGDLKAVALLASLVRSAEERMVEAVVSTPFIDDEDEKVVLGILKRLKLSEKGERKNADEVGAE